MHVDFKITTWERCEIPSDLTPEEITTLKDKILAGVITCYDDLDEEVGIGHHEIVLEAEEYMTPEDNGGAATIELFENSGEDANCTNGE
jgi:hypothetical protein